MNGVTQTESQREDFRYRVFVGRPGLVPKTITNVHPDARVRIRMRGVQHMVTAVVKTAEAISEHVVLLTDDDRWELFHLPERINFWNKKP